MDITERLKREVWEKGRVVPNFDPAKYRKDACGAWISWIRYGDKHSPYGWQIDHIYPEAKLKLRRLDQESIDDIRNLQPMHWRKNKSKGADYPTASAFNDEQFHKDICDDWIILSALYSSYPKSDVIIVSGDNGILLKAKNHGLGYFLMPDSLVLAEEPSDEEREIRQLKQ